MYFRVDSLLFSPFRRAVERPSRVSAFRSKIRQSPDRHHRDTKLHEGSPMAQPRTHGSPSPTVAAGVVIGMLVMLVLPAAFTLHSVSTPGTLSVGPNPSPHGYTWSLLLFIVPIFVIAFWFLPSEGLEIPHRAFWRTIWILVPLGFLLAFFFAQWFFTYPNAKATLGILAPAFGHWVPI